MHSTTVAVDLAKDVFEIAVLGEAGRVERRDRLSRTGFGRFLAVQQPSRAVMESCGGAHFWARQTQVHGHEVTVLPALYVKAYRRRNKTDRADCSALLEAAAHRGCGVCCRRRLRSGGVRLVRRCHEWGTRGTDCSSYIGSLRRHARIASQSSTGDASGCSLCIAPLGLPDSS